MLEVQRVSAHSAPLLRVCLPGLGVKSLAVCGQGWLIEKISCEERDGRCLSKGPHSFPSELLLSWVSCPYPQLSYLAIVPQSCPSPALGAADPNSDLDMLAWLHYLIVLLCLSDLVLWSELSAQAEYCHHTFSGYLTQVLWGLTLALMAPLSASCFIMLGFPLAFPYGTVGPCCSLTGRFMAAGILF